MNGVLSRKEVRADKKSIRRIRRHGRNKEDLQEESNNDDPRNMNASVNPPNGSQEYYLSAKYAADKAQNEKYAKRRNRDEYYMRVGKKDKYAKRRRGEVFESFYAMNAQGSKEFAKEKMEDGSERETYMTTEDGSEVYPEGNPRDRLFIRDEENEEMYAKKVDESGNTVEYPPEVNGEKVYIFFENGKMKIPFNVTNLKPMYRTNDEGDEIYEKDAEGNEYYAYHKKYLNTEMYAKDRNGRDIPARDNRDNFYYAQLKRNGKEVYPRTELKDEFYIRNGNREEAARTNSSPPIAYYYAKDREGNEMYPFEYFDAEMVEE